MSRKLTPEAEEKLIKAIEKSATLVNDGESPNSAIAKAASEDQVPPGHINLMVHAYNTGRTTRQRTEGDTPLEKSADFEMADAAQVLELMYPSNVKTAAAIVGSTIVSTQYAIPPTGTLARRELRQKRAQDVNWRAPINGREVEAPPPLPTDPTVRMKRAYCDSERLTRGLNESRRAKAAALDKMAQTFGEITDYFRSPASTPIPVVREQVTLMHGGKATQLIDEIVKVTPGLSKFSHHQPTMMVGKIVDASGEAYALVSQFLDDLDHYKQASANYDSTVQDHAGRQEALLRPFFEAGTSVLDEPPFSMGSEKRSAGMMPWIYGGSAIANLTSSIGKGVKAEPDKQVNKAYDALTDPNHEQDLRNIRTQAMLQDMMINDPVISGYDSEESLAAYNEIAQMAPRAQDQKLLMQSLMRKRLEQGSLDPFEVEQLLSMEEKQKKINAPDKVPSIGDATVL